VTGEVLNARFRQNADIDILHRNLIRQKSEIFATFPKGEGNPVPPILQKRPREQFLGRLSVI